ncbi:MAG: hypothetical protein M3Z04_14085 [Chloroflexota bacterium]|nr:hypothetical protein [Chloroflexota bacterium]
MTGGHLLTNMGRWPWPTGGGVALLAAGLGLHNGWSWAALPAGALLLGRQGAGHLYPWLGERATVRVYYRLPTPTPAPCCATLLTLLGQITEQGVQAVWHHAGDEVALYVTTTPGGVDALRDLLAAHLAGVEIVPVAALPELAGARWYTRRPAQGHIAGDLAQWLTIPGPDRQLRLAVTAHGAAALWVSATPFPGGRSLWRGPGAALWRAWTVTVPHIQTGTLPALVFPATDTPATAALDSARLHQEAGVFAGSAGPALTLGWASGSGEPVQIGLTPALSGPLRVLGSSSAARAATVSRLVADAQASGAGVLAVPTLGETTPAPAAVAGSTAQIDTEHPATSLHLNLLAPAPGDRAAALESLLTDRISLLSTYLDLLGLPAWLTDGGHRLLLDSARLAALTAYRQDTPWPDLGEVLGGLQQAMSPPARIGAERAAWMGANTLRGLPTGLAAQVQTLFADLAQRWATVPAARAGLLAGQAAARIRALLGHPWLTRPWPDAPSPTAIFNSPIPATVRLLPAPRERAARSIGLYLLLGAVAAAQDRWRSGQPGAPLLVLLDDPTAWLPDGGLPAYADLLAATGVTLLLPSATAPTDQLHRAGAWLALDLAAVPGVPDLPVRHLPAGAALVQGPGATGPAYATVYLTPPPPVSVAA